MSTSPPTTVDFWHARVQRDDGGTDHYYFASVEDLHATVRTTWSRSSPPTATRCDDRRIDYRDVSGRCVLFATHIRGPVLVAPTHF